MGPNPSPQERNTLYQMVVEILLKLTARLYFKFILTNVIHHIICLYQNVNSQVFNFHCDQTRLK